jgi:MFS family permease
MRSPLLDSKARRSLIIHYALAVFLYWMALYLYVPTLPTYVENKSATLRLVGVVLAQYGLWQALARLPVGILADWVGRRKPFIIVGFVLTGVGALVMGSTDQIGGLFVGRAITGLAAATWVPLVVAFSGLFPPHEAIKASALLMFVGSVGRVLATGVTGWLNDVGGYRLAFFIATGVAALATLVVLFTHETPRTSKEPSFSDVVGLVTRRDVLLPSLLAAVAQYANWASTFGFLPILAARMGASDVTLSMLLSLNVGVVTVGNLLTPMITKRLGARRLLYLSFVLLAAGIGGAALTPTLSWIFPAQICIGLSQSFGYPTMMGMSIQHVSEEKRATAMGLFQAVYAVGMSAGPALSGEIVEILGGIRPMFWITALVSLIVGLGMTYGLTRD